MAANGPQAYQVKDLASTTGIDPMLLGKSYWLNHLANY